MKRSLLSCISLFIASTLLAYDFEVDGIYYNKSGSNAEVVAGTNKYTGDVAIPASVAFGGTTYAVTSIGKEAFSGCSGLTSISIPDGVSVGVQAFYNCGVTTVSMGKNVKIADENNANGRGVFQGCAKLTTVTMEGGSIGTGAFMSCGKLSSLTLGKDVTSIGAEAFSGCSSLYTVDLSPQNQSMKFIDGVFYSYDETTIKNCLYTKTSVTIPENVTTIGNSAFRSCSKLESVTIPGTVTTIGERAFESCSGLTSISIPDGVSVNYQAFYNCGVTTVSMGKDVKIAGENPANGRGVFQDCTKLTTVTMEGGSVGGGAFKNCSKLSSLTLGKDVTSIGAVAFYGCSSLYTVDLSPQNQSMKFIDGVFYDETKVVNCLYTKTSVTIPENVTSIGTSAFRNCSKLESVIIPETVTTIGERAFESCSSLTAISIPDGVSVNYQAFYNCGVTTVSMGKDVKIAGENPANGRGVFQDCAKLTTVTMEGGSIGNLAFRDCSNLTNVTMGGGTIGNNAFSGCSKLSSLTLGEGVTSIGAAAFSSCKSLNTVDVSPLNQSMKFIDGAFYNLDETTILHCLNTKTTFSIPESVTTIGTNAFNCCTNLTSITIPESVTTIGKGAFAYSGLTSITIPDGVTIGRSAFQYCKGLKSVFIGSDVTIIGDFYGPAFGECENLETVTMKSGTIGSYTFKECSNLSTVTIDTGSVGGVAFFNCTNLTFFSMGSGRIIESSFNGCTKLNTVALGVSYIGRTNYDAFKTCTNLKNVYHDGTLPITKGSTDYGYVAYYADNVTIIAKSVELSKERMVLGLGQSRTLTATVLPEEAVDKTIAWTSSNEEVATVDENGVVTGHTEGEAIITATNSFMLTRKASCTVTVTDSKVVIDDFETPNSLHRFGGMWVADGNAVFGYADGGKSGLCLRVTAPSASVKAYLTDEDITTFLSKDEHPMYDASESMGVSFWHKGGTLDFFVCSGGSDDSTCTATIPAHEDWTEVKIQWDEVDSQELLDFSRLPFLGFKGRTAKGFYLDDLALINSPVNDAQAIKVGTVADDTAQIVYAHGNADPLELPIASASVGDTLYLYKAIAPADTTYKSVRWSSSNPDVAYADEHGRILGLNHGETYIYASPAMYPDLKDSILVRVTQGHLAYDCGNIAVLNADDFPTRYSNLSPLDLPTPIATHDFYQFHAWHLDSTEGDSVGNTMDFGDVQNHTLFAEFVREVPGTEIVVLQEKILAVANPNKYGLMRYARYVWEHDGDTLPSQKQYVELDEEPVGTYTVTIYIDDADSLRLERTFAELKSATIGEQLVVTNPVRRGEPVLLGDGVTFVRCFDAKGQQVKVGTAGERQIVAPSRWGIYVFVLQKDGETYYRKVIVL